VRIAQVSTVATPVKQATGAAGSVEAHVWLLTRELVRTGHEVTVFGCQGAELPGGAELVATLPGPYADGGAPEDWHLCEWLNLCAAVERSGRFDVIHSHAYLWGMPLQAQAAAPMVHTLHVWPYQDAALLWRRHPGAVVTAPSAAQWAQYPDLRPTVVAHGLDAEQFPLGTGGGDYMCWLGRFIPGKGPLEAIKAARASGRDLVMAGPANDYFDRCIRPHVDGKRISYAGELNVPERDELLGGACVLLYPVTAPEPFGMVLAEAMLCGTPVAAIRVGAVPELVDEGVSGVTVESAGELAGAIDRAAALDRAGVRAAAVEKFSPERMAAASLRAYEEAVAGVAR